MEIETIRVALKYLQGSEKLFVKSACNIEVIADDGSVIGKFLMVRPNKGNPFSPRDYDFLALNCAYFNDKELQINKLQIAINRLEFPYELSKETKRKYASFLRRKWLPELLEKKDTESIIKYAEHLITEKNLDEVLDKANATGITELVAFVLEYKQNKFTIVTSNPKLPKLKPVKPQQNSDMNFIRELQKEWWIKRIFYSELTLEGYRGNSTGTLTFPSFAGKKPFTEVDAHFTGPWINEITIPEGYKSLADCAFSYQGHRTINLPDSLTSIGKKAFFKSDLEEINLGKQLTIIAQETFSYCQKLREIKIPENVKDIEYQAFYFCTNLQDVEFGNRLESIGIRAFSRCHNLRSIRIPASLKYIAPNAFDHTGITNIELDPDNKYFIIKNGSLYTADLENKIISTNHNNKLMPEKNNLRVAQTMQKEN